MSLRYFAITGQRAAAIHPGLFLHPSRAFTLDERLRGVRNMMTRRILSCLVHLTLFGSIADGAPLRIDLNPDNGRKDVMTVGWQNWQIKEAPSVTQSFGGVNVTLKAGT